MASLMMRFMYFVTLWFKFLYAIPVPFWKRLVDLVTTFVPCLLLRGGMGNKFATGAVAPVKPLKLYEYEGCPFCRKVRESLSILGLEVLVMPTPRETLKGYGICNKSRFRPEVGKMGGKQMFPFLVDDNIGVQLYGSDDIVEHVWKTYGGKSKYRSTLYWRVFNNKYVQMPTLFLSTVWRPMNDMGLLRCESKRPAKPLELWGYENSPFVRLVREKLCALELPYLFHYMPYGCAAKRAAFRKRFSKKLSSARKTIGLCQVPCFVDPNTNVEMFESADIVEYLLKTYKVGDWSTETYADYSTKGASKEHGTVK
eukprot:NODE_2256_length_1102_cov_66.556923_g2238_i0.p1 GENE.NODE_2256_length_1102_cov_66.556923_g2238_i0~~NODE_2256_length_1102_cov_66.556923_g2238_i0.p1  ORF type:complete len:312 (-),score=65.91 NODE_2256_length_1102_cov_66.556923_g2238_i0:65-1000(-)